LTQNCSALQENPVQHSATISVGLNNDFVNVTATATDDIRQVAKQFCTSHSITFGKCPHFVSVELWNALWCRPGQKQLAKERGVSQIPRTFRFVHHPNYADSDEFSLLRPRFFASDYVECSSGMEVTGEEDALWVLGHLSGESGDDEEYSGGWPYTSMVSSSASSSSSSSSSSSHRSPSPFKINAFPRSTHLGDKDEMAMNLHRLAGHVGDRVIEYLPRTWQPSHLNQEEELKLAVKRRSSNNNIGSGSGDRGSMGEVKIDSIMGERTANGLKFEQVPSSSSSQVDHSFLSGVWVQKDPQKELGSGISLVEGEKVSDIASCDKCMLQRYVEDPMLLDGRKFSVGVYTALTGINPLQAWIHREMLILVCTRQYEENKNNASEVLAHLSNGLLNRRLNLGQVPECEGCEYNATDQVSLFGDFIYIYFSYIYICVINIYIYM
jgi:hypothetical protein